MSFEIDISSSQDTLLIDVKGLTRALQRALQIEQVAAAVLSISIVDNKAIHQINREHLQHDYPTDVISFQLDFAFTDEAPKDAPANLRAAGAMIEGEIIASAEMAAEMAVSGQWTAMHELTLYVIHGLLHICGYDDLSAEEKVIMRMRECAILNDLGLNPVYPDDTAA
ncbi:MAG: rRNA maturation RNase YbeY [Planctomycetota bacterium]|nr:MAG: rRNA maturation RNase YbeY [Planctomycetota bacterium]